jgi:hypothetical protein
VVTERGVLVDIRDVKIYGADGKLRWAGWTTRAYITHADQAVSVINAYPLRPQVAPQLLRTPTTSSPAGRLPSGCSIRATPTTVTAWPSDPRWLPWMTPPGARRKVGVMRTAATGINPALISAARLFGSWFTRRVSAVLNGPVTVDGG